jgi:glycosyltransferase involved in cell wall biosynthesis
MRPALYYPWVYLKGGAERVILELMTRSRHDWTLYTNHFEPNATFPELSQVRVVRLPEISVRRNIQEVARAGATLLTQRVDLAHHDSLFVISEGLGNIVAARSAVPTSCICLTPLKVVYDPYTRDQFFASGRRHHYRVAFSLYEMADRRLWRSYVRVFTNSQEVRRRLVSANLVDSSRVEVAHHGVDHERWQPDGRREKFFLVPGRIMWQKNVQLALDAWARFKPRPSDNEFHLVVAGMVDAKSRPYLNSLMAKAADRPDVTFIPGPTDAEMLDLYQRCRAVVFTPANEDWGLVPLEAMACGKPVLATRRGGPRESVVDGVTGFLRLDHPRTFAGAMSTLATMPTARLDEMGAQARARALEFPWSRFVERIDDHVEELAPLRGLAWRRMPAPPRSERPRAAPQPERLPVTAEPLPVEAEPASAEVG